MANSKGCDPLTSEGVQTVYLKTLESLGVSQFLCMWETGPGWILVINTLGEAIHALLYDGQMAEYLGYWKSGRQVYITLYFVFDVWHLPPGVNVDKNV